MKCSALKLYPLQSEIQETLASVLLFRHLSGENYYLSVSFNRTKAFKVINCHPQLMISETGDENRIGKKVGGKKERRGGRDFLFCHDRIRSSGRGRCR